MCEDLKKILPYISDTSQKKTGNTANKNSDSKKKPGSLFFKKYFKIIRFG